MNIVVCCKVVPDDQDIIAASDGSLDYSKAKPTVSTYDLNAIEAAVQLAATVDNSRVVAISVGPASIDDSKLKKNILARGVDELLMIADDALVNLDAFATSMALKTLVEQTDDWDLILCGDGSADLYAQQTDVQLASLLDAPYVSGTIKIAIKNDAVVAERLLENEVETVEVPLPAVVSVSPDIALPRICGMKDILAAGKKPSSVASATGVAEPTVEIVSEKAPEQADRKLHIYEVTDGGALEQFAAAIKAAL